jgi:hypothetical protein
MKIFPIASDGLHPPWVCLGIFFPDYHGVDGVIMTIVFEEDIIGYGYFISHDRLESRSYRGVLAPA